MWDLLYACDSGVSQKHSHFMLHLFLAINKSFSFAHLLSNIYWKVCHAIAKQNTRYINLLYGVSLHDILQRESFLINTYYLRHVTRILLALNSKTFPFVFLHYQHTFEAINISILLHWHLFQHIDSDYQSNVSLGA